MSDFNFERSSDTEVTINKDWFEIELGYTDSENAPIDLTGYNIVMTIKDALSGNILLTLTTISSSILTGMNIPTPATGKVSPQILAADSASIAAGSHFYQTIITDTLGHDSVWMEGRITFFDRGF